MMRSKVAESGFKQTMADKSLGTKTARFGSQLFGLCALLFIVCWVVFPGAWRIAALQDKSVIAVGVLSMVFVVGMFGDCLFFIVAWQRPSDRAESNNVKLCVFGATPWLYVCNSFCPSAYIRP